MNLSNTSKYAIRILSFMAKKSEDLITAKYIVEKLRISDKYLRRIMTQLSKAKLIESKQGRDGGYFFIKPMSEIFIIDIILAVESTDKYFGCVLGFSECSDDNPCTLHNKWVEQRTMIQDFFKSTSLAELIKNGATKF